MSEPSTTPATPTPVSAEKAAGDSARGVDFKDANKAVSPTLTVGHGGVAIYGGRVVDKDRNPKLRGGRKFQTYSELLANVSIVAASVRLVLNMIGKAEWSITPAANSGSRGEEIAELVEDILHDMTTPWHRVVRRAGMFPFYGFSWQEWTAKRRDDGVIGFLDIEPRSQSTIDRWDCDESGTVFGVGQLSPQTQRELYIPRAKSIYVVDDTISESPEGLGILRTVTPAADRLMRYEQLEGFGFETDLRGIPVGRAPYAALQQLVTAGKLTAAQRDEAVSAIEDFVKNHVKTEATGMVLDSMTYTGLDEAKTPSNVEQWGLDLLKSGNTSQEAVANSISRLNREIARMFGTEGLLLGEGGGSMALSKDKSNTVGLIVDGTLVELALVFQKDVLDPLFALNGWDRALKPTLSPQKLQHRDVREIAETLESLGRAGAQILPNDPAVNALRRILGIPEIDLDEIDFDSDIRSADNKSTVGEEVVDDTEPEATPGATTPGDQDNDDES